MLVIPAIDIRHGNCVRLFQGKADHETVYSNDPLEVAVMWKMKGATMLHVADLDGAFDGKPKNLERAIEMKQETGLPVQIGGGYRDIHSIEAALNQGIDRVILGTVAVYNPDLVIQAVDEFGSCISVSIDVADDFVAVSGWKEISTVRYEELVIKMCSLGVAELLFTDTRKDGTLSGPNIAGIKHFLSISRSPVIASGGVTSLEDIQHLKALEKLGLKGCVIGKALYDKKIDFTAAVNLAR